MTENNWYTFKSAGEKIGKSHSYFYSHFKKNPQYFKEGTFKKEGRIWLISDEGINHVLKQIKKYNYMYVWVGNTQFTEDNRNVYFYTT